MSLKYKLKNLIYLLLNIQKILLYILTTYVKIIFKFFDKFLKYKKN